MNPGVTAERVYDALKRHITSGEMLPGDKLELVQFAGRFNSSVTPVRDALHRLAGERLIEMRASEGFYLPLVTEPRLRDLYAWNAALVRMLIHAWPDRRAPLKADKLPADVGRATPAFFELFVGSASNHEHVHQMDAANDRLAAPRAAERRLFDDLEVELRNLAMTFDNGSTSELHKIVAAYHRRRLHAASAIVRALYG